MTFKYDKLSILVVEDTKQMNKLICTVLETLGVENILSAKNGEQGFDVFRKNNPDIVISDWQMKPVNGIELTKLIRNSPESPNRLAPVILMTGYSTKDLIAEARDVGVTEFLVKPFSENELSTRIVYVINRPRDFVDITGSFIGPDRRRWINPNYEGPLRRETDKTSDYEGPLRRETDKARSSTTKRDKE